MAEPRKPQPEADVIVVLGSKLSPTGRPTPSLKRRIAQAVRLFHQGRAENLLLSGGVHDHPTPEAEVMAYIARAAGVGAENIVIQALALNARENAPFTAARTKQSAWPRPSTRHPPGFPSPASHSRLRTSSPQGNPPLSRTSGATKRARWSCGTDWP